jgi:hypothetical protein
VDAADWPPPIAPSAAPPPPVAGPIVVDAWNRPVPDVAVLIGGSLQRTDATGRFVVPPFTSTYDAVLVLSNATGTKVFEYDGMTATAPVFYLWTVGLSGQAHQATLQVENVPDTWEAYLDGAGVEHVSVSLPYTGNSTGNERDFAWDGPASAQLHLLLLAQRLDPQGVPTGYLGAGYTATSLTDGQNLSLQAPDLQPVPWPIVTVNVSVTSPPGVPSTSLSVAWGGQPYQGDLSAIESFSPSASMAVVQMPGTTYELDAHSWDGFAWSAPVDTASALDGTTVALIAPPVPVAPSQGAQGVTTSTEFAFDPVAGAVNFLELDLDGSFYQLAANHSPVHIPDTSLAGVALPRGAGGAWVPFATTGYTTMDDFASGGPNGGVAGALVYAQQWTFTTAP